MNIYKLLMLIACSVVLTGCLEPSPESTSKEDAQALVDSFTYVKSRNGLCFGVTTVAKMSTNATLNKSNVVVLVDCNTL